MGDRRKHTTGSDDEGDDSAAESERKQRNLARLKEEAVQQAEVEEAAAREEAVREAAAREAELKARQSDGRKNLMHEIAKGQHGLKSVNTEAKKRVTESGDKIPFGNIDRHAATLARREADFEAELTRRQGADWEQKGD